MRNARATAHSGAADLQQSDEQRRRELTPSVMRAGRRGIGDRSARNRPGGSGAAMPPVPGLAEASPWTNREITTASTIPARLLVLGGGVVGVEMAQAYATLGSRVTLVEAEDRLIPREEPFAGEELRQALTARGVDVRTGVRAETVRRDGPEVTRQSQ